MAGAVGGALFVVLLVARVIAGWPPDVSDALLMAAGGALAVAVPALQPAGSRRGASLIVQVLSASGAAATLAGLTLLGVVGFGRVPEGDERQLVLLALLSAAAGGALFGPVRRRLARWARGAVWSGPTVDAAAAVRLFGRRMRADVSLDEVLLQVAETLRPTMALSAVEVWTGADGVIQRVVSMPDRGPAALHLDDEVCAIGARAGVTGPAWAKVWMPDLLRGRSSLVRVAPLGFAGALLGLIVVERDGEVDFSPDEEAVLADLTRQIGLALHNSRLDHALQGSLDEVRRQARELEASRRRLATAADEERRRIERDLHDGAQQHLVALSVSLDLLAEVMEEDRTAAATVLAGLKGTVREAVEELRALAHGIYPPLLRDSGLGAALRAAAARSPLDVAVDDGGIGRLPPDVEAAVYFCCVEALQNAAKHAPQATVDVRAWKEAGGLFFEVADDGPGFDTGKVTQGAGFTNMSDRLGAVGGRVEWSSAPGRGTKISGVVPLVSR